VSSIQTVAGKSAVCRGSHAARLKARGVNKLLADGRRTAAAADEAREFSAGVVRRAGDVVDAVAAIDGLRDPASGIRR